MGNRWGSSWGHVGRVLLVLSAVWIVTAAVPVAAQATYDGPVTFTKDIAPILQKSCQQCHRPDSVAPMSLLTYEQARPYARAMKQRTQLAYVLGNRGVMPPWFVERNIGVQKMKEDIRLSDEEIANIAKWADSGAPQGNPADLPPARDFGDAGKWFLGKPDLIVSSPPVFVKGVGPDRHGWNGETPTGLNEDRYARSAEYKETSNLAVLGEAAKPGKAAQGKTSIFVFHHASIGLRGIDGEEDTDEGGDGGGGFPLHEVGRTGDSFHPEGGRLIPGRSIMRFNGHIHSPGIPGADRTAVLNVGLKFHPKGYKPNPNYVERGMGYGRTEIDFDPQAPNTRYDAYTVLQQPIRLLNYEPHMHATGMRMCIEAIYRGIQETISCAGYDHNWVKSYYYDDNAAPLLPKGTIIHAIGWFDNSSKNANNVDPRNPATYGASSISNMFIDFSRAAYLTEEQYQAELAKRREHLRLTGEPVIACPDCYLTPAPSGSSTQ
jgi:mono/diheme cytochrome c family protein